MDNPNPIFYRDLITPDDSITKLIGQLDELINKYDSAKSKIQGAAAEVAKGLQGVSGASEEQRKAIELATQETDKLEKEYRSIYSSQMKLKQESLELAAAKKEETQVTKLLQQLNVSADGSYNRLSAQYRLNKIRLNEMSAAERAGTQAGRELERETAALYEEMKRLQEATGKHTLNVGNYADAGKSLRQELRSLTSQMAYLKTQGEQDSQEYQEMTVRAGQLKDALRDANREVKAMSSDTRTMDAVMGAAGAASGGLAVVTGATQLFGASSDTAAETQRKLGSAIAIVSGVTAVQMALQKESNLMVGIGILQKKAATKAEQMETAAKSKNIIVTGAATIAQRIFNAVAAANPYVLLAMALISVVGALVAFTAGTDKAEKKQKEFIETLNAELEYNEHLAESWTQRNKERIQGLENELSIAKARGASEKEIQEIEDKIYEERVKGHDKQKLVYDEELKNLDANREKLDELYRSLSMIQTAKAQGARKFWIDIDMDGKLDYVKIDKALDAVQSQIDYYGRAVQIAVDLNTEEAQIQTDRQIQLINRRTSRGGQDRKKIELDALRATEDARMAMINDAYERERKMMEANTARTIEDINTRLKKERGLTKKAREALNEQIVLLEEKLQSDLAELRKKYDKLNLAAIRETEDMQIAMMEEGAEKQRTQLAIAYQRQKADLEAEIADERNLTETQRSEMYKQLALLAQQYQKDLAELNAQIAIDEMKADESRLQLRLESEREGSQEQIDLSIELWNKQRAIELAENAQLTDDVRQSEADINAKWDAEILKQTAEMTKKRALMILDARQELDASEFALLNKNERQKTQFQLQQEKARLEKILELDAEADVKMTEQARKAIQNTIAAIEKEASKMQYQNLFELLGVGLDSDQQSALTTAIDSVKDSVSSLVDSWNQAAEAASQAAKAQVEAAQSALDAEIQARENGYANNVTMAQKELELARATQEKALKDKQKAQKAQLALDSMEQKSSLITATANLWKAFAGMGAAGIVAASLATATMWGSFAAAKIKAFQVTQQTEQYGQGTVELLQGGSHASGHDIDLGTAPNGKRRRAEGGEYFAIINKRNSRRYGHIIPDVINSFNNGTFAERYQRANAEMAGYAVGLLGAGSTDVSGIERDVAAIRKQGDESRFVDAQGFTVIRYKNLTRKIKS